MNSSFVPRLCFYHGSYREFDSMQPNLAGNNIGIDRLAKSTRGPSDALGGQVLFVIDAGYFAKRVVRKPDWLEGRGIVEICSVSNCLSEAPEGWIGHWLHNEFGWFNRPSDAISVVPEAQRTIHRLFAYRIYPQLFRNGSRRELVLPGDVRPEPISAAYRSLGFDSVSKSMGATLGFDCSPLSCNSMATECATNEFCLFESLDAALAGATRFSVEQPEPGDYYIVEVLETRGAA